VRAFPRLQHDTAVARGAEAGGAASSWRQALSPPVLWAAAAHDATTPTASAMKLAIAAAGDGVAVPGATGTLRRGARLDDK